MVGSPGLPSEPLSRPSEALSRPSEALSRPSEALSRPSEALSRPSEALPRRSWPPTLEASAATRSRADIAVTSRRMAEVYARARRGATSRLHDALPLDKRGARRSAGGRRRVRRRPLVSEYTEGG